jgi:hypothetical protein
VRVGAQRRIVRLGERPAGEVGRLLGVVGVGVLERREREQRLGPARRVRRLAGDPAGSRDRFLRAAGAEQRVGRDQAPIP